MTEPPFTDDPIAWAAAAIFMALAQNEKPEIIRERIRAYGKVVLEETLIVVTKLIDAECLTHLPVHVNALRARIRGEKP